MSATERRITPADILCDADYVAQRNDLRSRAIAMKKNRRVEVGPFATFYFENYETMWLQVQEMLRIEKGGAEQLAGELEAYNPLIPQGQELIATLMLEIEDRQAPPDDAACVLPASRKRCSWKSDGEIDKGHADRI